MPLLLGLASLLLGAADPDSVGVRAPERGLATYYAGWFHGRRTASGVPFDSGAMVAAHPTLPFGTRVRVTRVSTGAEVIVYVVDRGPAAAPRARGVIIDLSPHAAADLGFIRAGRTKVRLDVLPAVARRYGAADKARETLPPASTKLRVAKAATKAKAKAKAQAKAKAKAKAATKRKRTARS